jgi:hypothetical protein
MVHACRAFAVVSFYIYIAVPAAAAAAADASRGFQPKPFRETCIAAEYGSREPPVYDLAKVTAPVVIFAGDQGL